MLKIGSRLVIEGKSIEFVRKLVYKSEKSENRVGIREGKHREGFVKGM